MLVLARKKGEKVVVDGDIIVQVLDVQGDKVKLGFDASRGVPIDRWEVHESKRAERDRQCNGGGNDHV